MSFDKEPPRFSEQERREQAGELRETSNDMRLSGRVENPQVEEIKKRRDELITNLKRQLPAAKKRGDIHEAEILASIENLRRQADEQIKAIKGKS